MLLSNIELHAFRQALNELSYLPTLQERPVIAKYHSEVQGLWSNISIKGEVNDQVIVTAEIIFILNVTLLYIHF